MIWTCLWLQVPIGLDNNVMILHLMLPNDCAVVSGWSCGLEFGCMAQITRGNCLKEIGLRREFNGWCVADGVGAVGEG